MSEYVVATTVVDGDVAKTVESSRFPTTYDAWDALLNALDATTEAWNDDDALAFYGQAVRSAVNADQALPGFVAMTAPTGQLVVMGVIETGRP